MKLIKLFIIFVFISLVIGVGDAFSTPLDSSINEESNDCIEEILND